jgi:HNH endonuclease
LKRYLFILILKGYVKNSLRFWGGVAETNYNLLKGGATFGIAVAANVLKSEGEKSGENAKTKEGDSENTEKAGAGNLPKPGKGKGTVEKKDRDPKRVYNKKEKEQMLEKQDGKCAECGNDKTIDEVDGHHKERHADGGKTDMDNGAAVCKECHKNLHR